MGMEASAMPPELKLDKLMLGLAQDDNPVEALESNVDTVDNNPDLNS